MPGDRGDQLALTGSGTGAEEDGDVDAARADRAREHGIITGQQNADRRARLLLEGDAHQPIGKFVGKGVGRGHALLLCEQRGASLVDRSTIDPDIVGGIAVERGGAGFHALRAKRRGGADYNEQGGEKAHRAILYAIG